MVQITASHTDNLKPGLIFKGLPSSQHWPAHNHRALILVSSSDSKFMSLYLLVI